MHQTQLSKLSSGGGCGCKVSPEILSSLLAKSKQFPSADDHLLVGNETSDDCAAYLVGDGQVVVSSADFFMPIVDDPFIFGRIAATNALSDIYAMGAQPIFALALAGMPLAKLSQESIGEIFSGGAQACEDAGIKVAGGHTIDSAEPIYGLAVNGLCAENELLRNSTAQAGDVLLLTKPLGVGILSALIKQQKASDADVDNLVATTTKLNSIGARIGKEKLARAMTDVTGFGLLGHLLEICQGSDLSAQLIWDEIELLPNVAKLAKQGIVTGASSRNWKSYKQDVDLGSCAKWQQDLLCDPQTSGGLLIAAAPENSERIIELAQGCAKIVGTLGTSVSNHPRVKLTL